MDGLFERDAAFFDQHHEGDARDRLGHGVDAEDRVVLDGDLALDIGQTLNRVVDQFSAPIDRELGSREAAGFDVTLA